MTCSSSYLKFSKKESNVSWIGDSFRNVKEFYKYIQDKKIGKIYSLNYAYQTSQRKPFIIIGKIIRLSPRLTDIRKAVCKKAEPATTLLVKELVAENGNILFGKVFKVKFVGKIASDVESSDIHIGDRIALVSPTISQNTDFVQHPDINPLSALLFDGTQSSVLFCAKLPVGVLMPKNKCLSRLRCSTPVSDGRSELEASESECVENKGKMSSSSGALMKSVLKRNILKEHAKQNSPKKKSNQNTQKLKNEPCNHPALSSDIQSSYDATGPKTMKAEKSSCSPQKSLKQKDVAVEDDDGNCKIEHVAEDNQLINQDLITSFVSFKKNDRNINHNFIKIRDVNERHINKKIDMFVIVLDVRQNEVEGKKKKCLVARVIDDTCNRFKPFTVYIYFEDKKPKVEPKWILRLRHVKIESYNGICDGRVFSAGSVVAFSPNCSDLEREKPITLRKAPYECNDYDMSYVSNLRKFLLGKHWNLISMMEGFYPTPPDIVKQTTLADITDETWFSLKCKIVHVRMFFDYNVIVLTVTDGTEFPHFSYCVPRECKLWSETVVSKERYFSDLKEIDIILKNVGPAFDSSVLKAQNSVLIHNIQVVRNRSKNLEAIIFVIDASRPECKIEIIPTLADLKISSVAEENCSVTNAGTNEVSGQQESNSSTFDKIYKEKIISVARGLCDTSIDLDKDAVVDEAAKYCLEKQGVKRKKLFYQDSSNFDELISETESTSDFYEFSKSNKVKKCSVVLNKVPDEPIIVDLNEANVSSNVKDVTLNEVVVVNNEVNNSKDNLCEKDNVTSTFDECRKAKNVSHSSTDFDCDDEIPLKRIILSDDKRVPPCKSNVASDTVVKESTTNKQAEFYEPIPEKEKDHSRLSAPHSRINVSCNKEKNYELHQHHEGEEEWLQNIENVGSDDNVVESRLAGSSHDRGKESEGTKIVVHSTSNKETESQSQNVSEFIKANPQANSMLNMPMSAIIVNKQMSFKALMWELQPKITDNPLDIVSGLCENSCENFFLFSTLKYSLDSKPICPLCLREGKEVKVKLQFLFELLLMIQTGHSVTALVYGDHAVKFFGCTVEQYLHCPEARLEVIRKLQYFLGAGHNSSIRYTPPFPVHLIPISLTGSDKTSAIRFCVINTELPPVNYQSVNSLFINSE